MKVFKFAAAAVAGLAFATNAHALFLIQVDTDGFDDGPITFHPNFSFGNGGTTATTSAHSAAVGLADGDSIFGGDGVPTDLYQFSYTPGTDADNLALAGGTALNDDGDVATGNVTGATGTYRVYVTWPFTSNVSDDGISTFEMVHDSGTLTVPFDQNGQGLGTGNEWILIGEVDLTNGTSYTLSQDAGNSLFVSQRIEGVLFDYVPEPASLALLGLGGLALLRRTA